MNKNLLVGNGLNICLNITELNQESIAQRFREVILRSNPLYENLFKVHFTPNTLNNIFSVVPNQSIETLAYYLYNYIHVNMYDQTTLNSEIRLLNAIKTSALNAIFFEKNHPINLKTDDQKIIHHIQKYENVFSLNYIEFWDDNHCTYLHGKYIIPQIDLNDKPILLYDSDRFIGYKDYDITVYHMCKSNNMVSFDGYNLIFSPLFDKQEVIDLSKYPNKTLYPAEDLFPSEPIKLYEELDHISSLDVFGVSPYGDDRLIQKISEIPNLQIYVYNMNPEEVYSWNNKLKRECCIDSSLFVV